MSGSTPFNERRSQGGSLRLASSPRRPDPPDDLRARPPAAAVGRGAGREPAGQPAGGLPASGRARAGPPGWTPQAGNPSRLSPRPGRPGAAPRVRGVPLGRRAAGVRRVRGRDRSFRGCPRRRVTGSRRSGSRSPCRGSESAEATCALEGRVGGRVFETGPDGTVHLSGTVTAWGAAPSGGVHLAPRTVVGHASGGRGHVPAGQQGHAGRPGPLRVRAPREGGRRDACRLRQRLGLRARTLLRLRLSAGSRDRPFRPRARSPQPRPAAGRR